MVRSRDKSIETLSVVRLRLTGSITPRSYPRVISPALGLHKNGLIRASRPIGQEKAYKRIQGGCVRLLRS